MEETIDRLRKAAGRAFAALKPHLEPDMQERGVHVQLFDFPDPSRGLRSLFSLYGCWVGGTSNAGRAGNYVVLAHEKSARLAKHVKLGHRTSGESADSQRDEYAGAITALCVLVPGALPRLVAIGVSGVTAEGDEAMAILTAHYMDCSTADLASIIAHTQERNLLIMRVMERVLAPA